MLSKNKFYINEKLYFQLIYQINSQNIIGRSIEFFYLIIQIKFFLKITEMISFFNSNDGSKKSNNCSYL